MRELPDLGSGLAHALAAEALGDREADAARRRRQRAEPLPRGHRLELGAQTSCSSALYRRLRTPEHGLGTIPHGVRGPSRGVRG